MTRCPDTGCPGTIDDEGFCDVCGRQDPTPGPRSVSLSTPASVSVPDGGVFRVADLFDLPVRTFPHPESRVLTSTTSSQLTLRCGKDGCRTEIGGSYAGQPALSKGFCPNCGTPYSFDPQLAEGDLVADQYEVVGPLKHGGMGWVYLAKDKHLDDNYVALKGIINANDQRAVGVAIAERRFLTSIDHPNIVRIFNFVQLADAPDSRTGYIVMEYLNGASLEEIGPDGLPLEEILAYGHEMLAALQYLHGRGLLFCDLKPDNVMCTADRVTLIDLGGVRAFDSTDPVVRAEGYHDPDEFRHAGPSPRSDLYAAGKTLATLYWWGGRDRHTPLGLAVESFRRLTVRATAPWAEIDRRFGSATEMVGQLKGVLREVRSVRLDREHPERSTLFAPTPVLLHAGLGAPPALRVWLTRQDGYGLPACRLDPESVALGLPEPLPHPDDPNVDVLSTLDAPDPARLISQVAAIGAPSVESHLALCRARLELSDVDGAAGDLRAAAALFTAPPEYDWRIMWHRGLLALARADVPAAATMFDAVYGALPGEPAPKLALGACAELVDDWAGAESYYSLVWRCDRTQVNAAFGLARVHLRRDERSAAVAVLDGVPAVSRHYPAAGVAAIQAHFRDVADPPGTAPTSRDLAAADVRIDALPAGRTRDRLRAGLCEVELAWFERDPRPTSRPEARRRAARERRLRTRLEKALRALAGHARDAGAHGALIDEANRVRARTLV